MAAVISRALADLEKNSRAIRTSDHVRDEAMAWINGPECGAFCYALGTDYRTIREQAAALYRRFPERADDRGTGRPRTRSPGGHKTSNPGSAANRRKA
jgi:plasmid stabilization system protein ParE